MSQKNLKEDEASANGVDAARVTLLELARQQGVRPVTDVTLLRGDFWPKSESIDDLIHTVRAWRDESEARRND